MDCSSDYKRRVFVPCRARERWFWFFVACWRSSCDVEGRISLRKLELRESLKHDHDDLDLLAMLFLKQGKGKLMKNRTAGSYSVTGDMYLNHRPRNGRMITVVPLTGA